VRDLLAIGGDAHLSVMRGGEDGFGHDNWHTGHPLIEPA
jgi:hypothetical protein